MIILHERLTPLGNKLVKRLLCGKRYFAENLMITPLGIPLTSLVGGFDELRWGGRKNFAEDDLSAVFS